MKKLFALIGAMTVIAGIAAVIANFLYDIRFSLSINKKDHPCLCNDDDDDFDVDDDEPCCCAAEEVPAEEAAAEEVPADDEAEKAE